MPRQLGIPLQGLGVLVLREGRHPCGRRVGVVAHDDVKDHRVGEAVGQVELGAKSVGHGVVHAEEGVGEGHACNRGRMVDLLPGLLVSCGVGRRQVLEEEPHGAHGEWHREVRGPNGDGRFDCVDKAVEAGVGDLDLGEHLGVAGIHDGNVRHEPVAAEPVLHTTLRHRRKGRDLGAGSGGRGDGDEPADLLRHVREHGRAAAQLEEPHDQLLEARVWVLVEEADHLGGIYWAASAEGDDDVRLEALASPRSSHYALERGLRLNLREDGVLDLELPEPDPQLFYVAQLHHVKIGNDECPTVNAPISVRLLEVVQGLPRAVPVEVGVWHLEPLDVVPDCRELLDVHQHQGSDIRGGRRPCHGSHAQRQAGVDVEVVGKSNGPSR
mmetsp:Transcript_151942/g.368962  ORF Transcript_151942/g.368962 Transcript_151942/m.368962 type:complete len:383 (+) Transcript_151942:385-1533(+)